MVLLFMKNIDNDLNRGPYFVYNILYKLLNGNRIDTQIDIDFDTLIDN